MRILITGAAGFLGYHTAKALIEREHQLVLVDDLSRGEAEGDLQALIAHPRVEFHQLDLTREQSWEVLGGGHDAVFHFAAINGTRHFYEHPFEVLVRNIELVRRMLSWHAQHAPNSQIIWTSSSEVYAGIPVVIPTPEDTPVGVDDVFNPRYSYAISKLAGESLIINYARDKGVRFTVIRPHNIYGPRMGTDHVIPQFILRIHRRETPFRIFGGDQTRAFCYVDDCVRALLTVLNRPEADSHVIHVGDDRLEVPIRKLAEQLFQLTGWHPPVELQPPPPGSPQRRRPDLQKARRLLGYEPRVDLLDGLRLTLAWHSRVVGNEDSRR